MKEGDDGACVRHEFVFLLPPYHCVFFSLMFGSFYCLVRGAVSSEYIKCPDSSKPPQRIVTNGTNNTRKSSVTATNPQANRPGTQGSLTQPEPGVQSISPVQQNTDPETQTHDVPDEYSENE